MSEPRREHLVMYDIRDPERWRRAYKIIRGYGVRVQYSIFRVKGTKRSIEQLRWELERVLAQEDDLLIIGLCPRCLESMLARNREHHWPMDDDTGFSVL